MVALTRQAVLRAALSTLDDVGLDRLTLQRIAKKLDVQTPALYWHFKNKQQLLDHMADELVRSQFEDFGLPSPEQSWDRWLTELSRRIYRTLLSHRDGARLFAGSHLQHGFAQRSIDNMLTVLQRAGFSAFDALVAGVTVVNYATGTVMEQQSIQNTQLPAKGGKGQPEPTETPEALDQLSDEEKVALFNPDVMFEHGLQLLINGLRTRVPAATSTEE
ncbi:MAG: TetR/AcrR family transcriptional regulator C-terminal domain-containing protein [Actinocatenispora sp.]